VDISPDDFAREGVAGVAKRFDAEHEKLFTFALDAEHELVGLRAVVQGGEKPFINREFSAGSGVAAAVVHESRLYADGAWHETKIYDRSKLSPGDRVQGPAIVTEMDSTSLILPGHVGVIDKVGNILIWPVGHENAR
ncbi:MAG: hydantoinase/oxoprolinase family protein, partial [Pseudomonadota bacterium]